jgi:hypothetical protein
MTDRLRIVKTLCLVTVAVLLTFSSTLYGEEPKSVDAYYRHYWVDVIVFSVLPDHELATYRSFGGGGTEANASVGFRGEGDNDRRFDVSVKGKLKADRFLATVKVTPAKEGSLVQAQEIEYDLSDLTPRTLEIVRNEEGRVYRLNLLPRINQSPKPRPFKVSDLHLEGWHFNGSTVIVDDQDYMGELNMGTAPIAWCDIPGLAKIEFSLLHLKDASQEGTLENGVIRIAHHGTTLRITNVMNGNGGALGGGPYQVWVRWNEPTQLIEEFQESIKKQIETIKERIRNGDQSVRPGSLERLEKMIASGRIGQSISSGIRGDRMDDLEE